MEVIIVDNQEQVAQVSAQFVIELIRRKHNAVLGLATGTTPIATYQKLIAAYENRDVSFAAVRTFNLDEYLGIAVDDVHSFRRFMNEHFFNHIDIVPENTHVPDGLCANPRAEGRRFEALITRSGGIDLQILGIGRNGHIGFNEPGSSLASRTRIKTLAPQTRIDNFGAQHDNAPLHAITMGIGTILDARHVLLLAHGESKARAIANAVEGPITAMCPASALQQHARITVVIDEAAAQLLENKDYFRWAQQQNRELKQRFGHFYEQDV
jgi:glucosamine-6-phosphate deaminase